MELAELKKLSDTVANIYRASRPYATIFISVDEVVPIKYDKSEMEGGSIRIGDTVSIFVPTVDDVNRLRHAVNELALAMMKAENQS